MSTTTPMGRVLRALPAVTLVAVLVITASAEFELARTVLNLHPSVAWAVPVAIDSYVLAALRSRRDVGPALAVMSGSLAASMGAHLAAAAYGGHLPTRVTGPAAAAVMIVLVVVAWRVHVLIDRPAETATPPEVGGLLVAAPPSAQPPTLATPRAAQPTQSTGAETPAQRPAARPSKAPAKKSPTTRATVQDLKTAIAQRQVTTLSRDQVKTALGVGSTTATRLISEYLSENHHHNPTEQANATTNHSTNDQDSNTKQETETQP